MKQKEKVSGDGLDEVNEAQVRRFLDSNPRFIEENNDLLLRLSISHQAGTAVSLLEKQNNMLREKISDQKKNREELLKVAEKNWEYISRLNHLVKDLKGKVTLNEIYSVVKARMLSDFGADEIMMEISSKGTQDINFGLGVELLQKTRIQCEAGSPFVGPVKKEHKKLYEVSSKLIKSNAIIPMASFGWHGVIILGSVEITRYKSGERVEFLSHLRDILVLAIDPLLRVKK